MVGGGCTGGDDVSRGLGASLRRLLLHRRCRARSHEPEVTTSQCLLTQVRLRWGLPAFDEASASASPQIVFPMMTTCNPLRPPSSSLSKPSSTVPVEVLLLGLCHTAGPRCAVGAALPQPPLRFASSPSPPRPTACPADTLPPGAAHLGQPPLGEETQPREQPLVTGGRGPLDKRVRLCG